MSADSRLVSSERVLEFLLEVKALAVEQKKRREFQLEQEAIAWTEETRETRKKTGA